MAVRRPRMPNEVEAYQNPALATTEEHDDFFDMPVEEHVKPKLPLLKLAQAQTEDKPDGVNNGEFYNTATGEVFGTVDALMMYCPPPRRAYFQPYERGKKKPLFCSSSDGMLPSFGEKFESGEITGPCKKRIGSNLIPVCQYAKWDGSKPPECSLAYTALLWIMGSESPAIFTAMKGKVKAFEELTLEMAGIKKSAADKKHPEIPARFFVPIRISSVDVEGAYYSVKFELLTSKEHRPPVEYASKVAADARIFRDDLMGMSTAEITQTVEVPF